MSIFDPHSPGHDGALIIERGQLTSFGVRLPLSTTDQLPEEYGTRHHAAMGLAEVSDALIVAVSEERGSVMVFQNGRAKHVGTTNELQSQIASHWEQGSAVLPRSGKESRWGPLVQAALSLGMAFLFWSSIVLARGEVIEKGLSVSVEYTGVPPYVALVGNRPTEVTLHLSGRKSDLDTIDASKLDVKIDLSKAAIGKNKIFVTKERVNLPEGVELLEADPAYITLYLEELVDREASVRPQFVGSLPHGLKLVSVRVNPERIQVMSSAVPETKEQPTLVTAPIDLDGIEKDAKILTKIIASPGLRPLGEHWPDVEVTIMVSDQ